jgi:hypothetical protein
VLVSLSAVTVQVVQDGTLHVQGAQLNQVLSIPVGVATWGYPIPHSKAALLCFHVAVILDLRSKHSSFITAVPNAGTGWNTLMVDQPLLDYNLGT